MSRGLFVTATDTGVGKTVVAAMLLRALRGTRRAVGMKPVAAGIDAGDAVNADVRALIEAGNVDAPLSDINPYSFAPPIAPEIAARAVGTTIDVEVIAAAYARLAKRADRVIVEGAGGALVPLTLRTDMLDIPRRLGIPVLLVVGMRLGCINHALLSALAVNARGLVLAGWVANRIDPAMREGDANVAALAERLPAPLVADIAWSAGGDPGFALHDGVLRELGLGAASSA
ncbi:MAG TPA: dethiobiotin synthase [Casimicrobiaceae bacterium]|nr:dethiobiotin synthase [Casimicrobiaceae bacterium]